MSTQLNIFLEISIILIVSFGLGHILSRFKIPLVLGFLIGGLTINFVNAFILKGIDQFFFINLLPYIVDLTLGFIGFSVGAELEYSKLKGKLGKRLIIVLFESIGTFLVVGALVWWWTDKLYLGVIYGTIATATCPATTASVFKELKAEGELKDTVVFVLLIDDIVAITLASFALPFAISAIGGGTSILASVFEAFKEIGLSVLIGVSIGYLFTQIYKREKNPTEHVEIVLMMVLFAVGVSNHFHASPILTLMIVGIYTINSCKNSGPAFHEAEKLEKPFVLAFFTLIGLSFDITVIGTTGIIVLIYVVGRTIGKTVGAYTGAISQRVPSNVTNNLGLSLLSQAGVAIGLATYLFNRLQGMGAEAEEIGASIIATVTVTTILFQVIGPVGARIAILRAGEANKMSADKVLMQPQLMPLLTPFDPHD
ncbi:MAG: cation:proton antiporter [Candidatus Heimdallarchaeota archaeon]|nr:cation:proton antiporter [Candidatus Heimdallarchaeota archaeon]MCK5048645.1 cation:proton antiporter [Candidatus Heimdallarchaeota archaeon]